MRELIGKSWPRIKWILTLQVIGSTASALCVFCSGCATGYLADRARDGADVFTLTMSTGLGARARGGPLHAGLNATVHDIGLRGGAIESDGAGPCIPLSGIELFCFGKEFFWPHRVYFGDKLRCQMKTYYNIDHPYVPLCTPSLEVYDPKTDNKISDSSFSNMIASPYLTQIEIQASLLFGFRIGFNIGELADFILGWTTIDIYNDDVEWRKGKSNQAAAGTPLRPAPPR